MPRKIIQLAAVTVTDGYLTQCEMYLHALCDDGTVWRINNREISENGSWEPVSSVPQDNEAPAASETNASDSDLPTWLRGRLWVLGPDEPLAIPVNDVATATACAPERMAYANDAVEAAEIITRWCANDRGGMSMETPRIGDTQIRYISELPF